VSDSQENSAPAIIVPLRHDNQTHATSQSASNPTPSAPQVTFDRYELNTLLGLYGRKVADGEWRDYAMDFLKDRAVFSVFRRSTEYPLYRIEKNPKFARKQGAYSVVSAAGQILKRGHELARVLAVLEKTVRLVV
jgi:hypothetical protein